MDQLFAGWQGKCRRSQLPEGTKIHRGALGKTTTKHRPRSSHPDAPKTRFYGNGDFLALCTIHISKTEPYDFSPVGNSRLGRSLLGGRRRSWPLHICTFELSTFSFLEVGFRWWTARDGAAGPGGLRRSEGMISWAIMQ